MTSNAKPSSLRREFLQNTGRVAAATAMAGMIVPQRSCGREQHDQHRADRLRRPRHRRGGQRAVGQERPDQAGRHGRRVSSTGWPAATTT